MSPEYLKHPERGEAVAKVTPLTTADRPWLEVLGCEWPGSDTEAGWLEDINRLVVTGSQWIRHIDEYDTEARSEVLAAREEFLDKLTAITPKTKDQIRSKIFWIMPLDTVIDAQRTIHGYGLNNARLLNENPSSIGLSRSSIDQKVAAINTYGLDAMAVVSSIPRILGKSSESIKLKLDDLSAMGLDGLVLIRINPKILTYSSESILQKLNILKSFGINSTLAINKAPHLLNLKISTLIARINSLEASGINTTKVVTNTPNTLVFSTKSIHHKFENMKNLGINVPDAVNCYPALASFSPETLKNKIEFLNSIGLNASRIANAQPSALGLTSELIVSKLENITSHGLNAVEIVNSFPTILGYSIDSLKVKINLIYSVIKAWGDSDYQYSANRLINQWPVILGYKPAKIRTLARIVSDSLPPLEKGQIAVKSMREVVIANIDSTLAGYLENKNNISESADIRRISQKYQKLGKAACWQIIASHPHDPAVKAFLKGYKLPPEMSGA